MDGTIRQQVFVFLRIRLHVGRNGMRFEMIQARPFFHNEEGVRPKSFGESNTLAVDDGAVFNAPVFGMNGGNIGVKIRQDLFPFLSTPRATSASSSSGSASSPPPLVSGREQITSKATPSVRTMP